MGTNTLNFEVKSLFNLVKLISSTPKYMHFSQSNLLLLIEEFTLWSCYHTLCRRTESLWIYGYIWGPTACPGDNMFISRLGTSGLGGVSAMGQTFQQMLVLCKLLYSQFELPSYIARMVVFIKNQVQQAVKMQVAKSYINKIFTLQT